MDSPLTDILNLITLLSRWIHIVCTTLLVGGTLFYEMVVPIAIDDLKHEVQLAVFARARWVFRWIVWLSAGLLLLTGLVASRSHWTNYTGEAYALRVLPPATQPADLTVPTAAQRSGWWWAAHSSCGALTIIIALFLTFGNRPPDRPVQWMRLNLVLLMIVIFLGSVTGHVRLAEIDRAKAIVKAIDAHR